MLTRFTATATTCAVSPGSERVGDRGMLHIANRVFSDIVESEDDRIAGTNEPALDIDVDTTTGEASLQGRFKLAPKSGSGSWEGELLGHITGGLVTAAGLAHGKGALERAILRVDFRQVPKLAAPAPCADPKAFFEMDGWILER
jgi:hypothetical protein